MRNHNNPYHSSGSESEENPEVHSALRFRSSRRPRERNGRNDRKGFEDPDNASHCPVTRLSSQEELVLRNVIEPAVSITNNHLSESESENQSDSDIAFYPRNKDPEMISKSNISHNGTESGKTEVSPEIL